MYFIIELFYVIRYYGVEGLQEIIRKHKKMSLELEVDDGTKELMECIFIELETLAKGMTFLKEGSE